MSAADGGAAAGIAVIRDAIAAAAAEGRPCVPRGRGTKSARTPRADAGRVIDTAPLAGIVEYEPSEFTVTALGGTPIAAIEAALAEHRQYLPFDPILVSAGATLGGTIAAGVAGSGRVRYGGIRDFVLEVRFLDGEGRLVRGGGKVVKNAAGFDLPKLMVGSLGSLGVVVEATLKVFPAPEATATGTIVLGGLEQAVAAMRGVLGGPCEVDAIDLEPPSRVWIRVAGRCAALGPRLERALAIAGEAGRGGKERAPRGEALGSAAAAEHWREMRELAWVPQDAAVIKVPLQLGQIAALEDALVAAEPALPVRALFTGGGQQALIAWAAERSLRDLDGALAAARLSGLVVRGAAERRRLGCRPGDAALERVRRALDPGGRFLEP